mmetsp:Transcript_38426/g.88081  ORF Transcript_38426/g.88081 Transcript_38426/m.88081 type:complete len:353 (-) Transcript_38426:332-1390(-)
MLKGDDRFRIGATWRDVVRQPVSFWREDKPALLPPPLAPRLPPSLLHQPPLHRRRRRLFSFLQRGEGPHHRGDPPCTLHATARREDKIVPGAACLPAQDEGVLAVVLCERLQHRRRQRDVRLRLARSEGGGLAVAHRHGAPRAQQHQRAQPLGALLVLVPRQGAASLEHDVAVLRPAERTAVLGVHFHHPACHHNRRVRGRDGLLCVRLGVVHARDDDCVAAALVGGVGEDVGRLLHGLAVDAEEDVPHAQLALAPRRPDLEDGHDGVRRVELHAERQAALAHRRHQPHVHVEAVQLHAPLERNRLGAHLQLHHLHAFRLRLLRQRVHKTLLQVQCLALRIERRQLPQEVVQ